MTTKNENKKSFVKGIVSFYGKTKDYKGEKDIISLSIENPEFLNVTKETVSKMYGLEVEEIESDYELYAKSKGKKDAKAKNTISGMYHEILKGNKIEKAFFHTDLQYEPETVFNNENNKIDISEVEMNKATILMVLNKSYISAIKILENGTPYNPFE